MPTAVALPTRTTGPVPLDTIRDLLTADRKTAPRATNTAASGPRALDSLPNATWLPAGRTCPGQSAGCAGALTDPTDRGPCYAANLENAYPTLRAAAYRRLDTWHRHLAAGTGPDLAAALLRYSRDKQLAAGISRPTFRLHASGDFYSAAYADAWYTAGHQVAADPEPLHVWTYSRSYGAAGRDHLARLLDPEGHPPPRWTLYLSSDPTMLERTRRALAGRYHRLPVAMMAATAAEGRALLAELDARTGHPPRRTVPCPVDAGRMPQVVPLRRTGPAASKPPVLTGACTACRACIDRRTPPHIVFEVH